MPDTQVPVFFASLGNHEKFDALNFLNFARFFAVQCGSQLAEYFVKGVRVF